jgi:hypothetical protein
LEFHNLYAASDFKYVDEALARMGIMDIATMKEPFYPDLIRQFFCTAFFHEDGLERTVSWMSGHQQFSGTYDDFCQALGYDVGQPKGKAHGFRIHNEKGFHHSKLAFCVPPNPRNALPSFSSFYFTYHTLAFIFGQCMISRAGDHKAVRQHFVNLMWYSHPSRQVRIDVCDYLWQEIRRSVFQRMVPNYCIFVQKFLNKCVPVEFMTGERIYPETYSYGRRGTFEEAPEFSPERRTKEQHDPRVAAPSSSGVPSTRRASGAARFFRTLFDMCKHTDDVATQALEMSQETRRRQNEYFAEIGHPFPAPGPQMDPKPAVNFQMPPISDDMFAGYSYDAPAPRARRAADEALEDEEGDGSGKGTDEETFEETSEEDSEEEEARPPLPDF